MQNPEYAEIAIMWAYKKSLAHELRWQLNKRSMSAELISGITITINFTGGGADPAIWQDVMVKNPGGGGWTMMRNPAGRAAHLGPNVAAGTTLECINAIFDIVVLDPRQEAFAAAMAALQIR